MLMNIHTETHVFDVQNDLSLVRPNLSGKFRAASITAHLEGDELTVSISYIEDEGADLSGELFVFWRDDPPRDSDYRYNLLAAGVLGDTCEQRIHVNSEGRRFVVHMFTRVLLDGPDDHSA